MEILSLNLTDRAINWELLKSSGENGSVVEAHSQKERPLKSFFLVWERLARLIPQVMAVSTCWDNCYKLTGFSISYTKAGTRSVRLKFELNLEIVSKEKKYETPMFQFDMPAAGESQKQECSKAAAAIIAEMIMQLEKYADGERSQVLLTLENPETPEKKDGELDL